MFALMFTLIFGFMALAVDLGHAFVERRSSQSTADVAVVGGAMQTIAISATKEQNLVTEVIRLANVNIDIPADTGVGSAWDQCDDDDAAVLAITWATAIGGPSDCISWDAGFTKVRVKLPDRQIETWFAKILGINSIAVGAAAEAEVITEELSGVLPFGVLGNADDSVLCLKTGSGNGVPSDCEDNGTGNFHYIDFKTFGNAAIGTSTECGQANKGERLKENIAHGVDHDLFIGDPNVPGNNYFDASVCDGTQAVTPGGGEYPGALPWSGPTAADTETGTVSGVVLDGLVQGVTVGSRFFEGRLAVSGGTAYKGVPIDNVGLWSHLTGSARAACTDIGKAGFNIGDSAHGIVDGVPDTEDEIIACIDYFTGGDSDATPTPIPAATEEIFDTASLRGSPRYGWVPILHQSSWPSGTSSPISFKAYQPMYIQTMFGGKCYSDGTCDVAIVPGETWIGAGGKDPNALTGIEIPSWAVAAELRDAKDQVPQVAGYALSG